MKHEWRLDEYGHPDEWVLEVDYCNGVFCEVCLEAVCIHCHPNWAELKCEGDDGKE